MGKIVVDLVPKRRIMEKRIKEERKKKCARRINGSNNSFIIYQEV